MANDTIERFLRAEGPDLEVSRDKQLTIDPDRAEFAEQLHRLEARDFEDLQALSLIPPELDERRVRAAIAADDDDTWQTALRITEAAVASCGCKPRPEQDHRVRDAAADLHANYSALRRRRHHALADVVSKALSSPVAWDSLIVKAVYGWIDRLTTVQIIDSYLIVALYKDITIGHNATLTLISTVNGLWANHFRIYTGGELKINSSFIKIVCKSFQGDLT